MPFSAQKTDHGAGALGTTTHRSQCTGVTTTVATSTNRKIKMKTLSRTIVITGGLALSGMIVASLAVAGNFSHHQKRGHSFHAAPLDADGDGALTRDELMTHNRVRFDRLDSNGDGAISPDEYGARLVTMFSRMDDNGDGVLTGDELPRRMGRHGKSHGYDHDHDSRDAYKMRDAS